MRFGVQIAGLLVTRCERASLASERDATLNVHQPVRHLRIAVVGAGVSGLSAAWLLGQRHHVTLFEAASRPGGHANTVQVDGEAVDAGFVVYNEPNYPNLTALFAHLGVPTAASDMSFAVSLDDGQLEYSSRSLSGLLAQRRNLFRPRFWAMLRDLRRFYSAGSQDARRLADQAVDFGEYLNARGFCRAFREDHLLPQAAAIWSASLGDIQRFPAAALLRFFDNHGLMLPIRERPIWRTVAGGSQVYVERLLADFSGKVLLNHAVRRIARSDEAVVVEDCFGVRRRFDHVVLAAHADQSLAMLEAPTAEERRLLGAIRYSRNHAVVHDDHRLMPNRRAAWASWNHVGRRGRRDAASVTYWMNRLQPLGRPDPLFVTLNPDRSPEPERIFHAQTYEHPTFDAAALAAQRRLWSLQGERRTWYCGAYFGSGFHEDGLQAGLAVAEALGGVARPWIVPNPSGRICVGAFAGSVAA